MKQVFLATFIDNDATRLRIMVSHNTTRSTGGLIFAL